MDYQLEHGLNLLSLSHCALPLSFLKSQGLDAKSKQSFIVKIIPIDQRFHPFFLLWSGQISSSEFSLEVSRDIRTLMLIRAPKGTKVRPELIYTQFIADSVELVSCKQEDWELVNAHKNFIEDKFLTLYGLVFINQIVSIKLSSESIVRFKVNNIINETNIENSQIEVSKIATKTQLIISPNNNSPSPKHANISTFELRILPNKWIYSDTSYKEQATPIYSPSNEFLLANDTFDSILDQFLTDNLMKNSLKSFIWNNSNNRNISSHPSIAIIHPAYAIQSLQKMNVSFQSLEELNEYLIQNNPNALQPWMIKVQVPKSGNHDSTLPSFLYLYAIFSDEIEPWSIILPENIKLFHKLQNYDLISVEFIIKSESNKTITYEPQLIRLRPLISSEIIRNNSTKDSTIFYQHIFNYFRRIEIITGVPIIFSNHSIFSLPSNNLTSSFSSYDHFQIEIISLKKDQNHSNHFIFDLKSFDKDSINFLEYFDFRLNETISFSLPITKSFETDQPEAFKQNIGFQSIERHLFSQLILNFLPQAMSDQMNSNLSLIRKKGIVITGKKGFGKSYLLQRIEKVCSNSSKLLIHIEKIDIKSLYTISNITEALDLLKKTTFRLLSRAPSILLIDDLHLLSFVSKDSSFQQNPLLSEKKLILSLQLNRCLEQLFKTQNSDKSFKQDKIFQQDQEIASLKRNSVMVFATCDSLDSLDSSFTSISSFFSFFDIPIIDLTSRIKIFGSMIPEMKSFPDKELNELIQKTEGMSIQNICTLVKQFQLRSMITPHLTFDKLFEIFLSTINEYFHQFPSIIFASNHRYGNLGWKTIGGYQCLKTQFAQSILFPNLFQKLYQKHEKQIKLSKGFLLYGLPGNGKTLFAKTLAEAFHMKLVIIRGPELLNKYIGASELALRQLFQKIKQESNKSVLLCFDEFEALGGRRGRDHTGIADRIVNQLLTLIDGVEDQFTLSNQDENLKSDDEFFSSSRKTSSHRLYLLATTTRPDVLDPALLRSGRIDQHIYLPSPTTEDCKEILTTLISSLPCYQHSTQPLSQDIQLWIESHSSEAFKKEFTCADLKGCIDNAYFLAVQDYVSNTNHPQEKENLVELSLSCLEKAWLATQPSLSDETKYQFNLIYKTFQGKGNDNKNILEIDSNWSYK